MREFKKCRATEREYLVSAYPHGHCFVCNDYDKLQQELDAARAEIDDWKTGSSIEAKEADRLRKQLADAKAQINQLTYELDKSRDCHTKVIAQQHAQIAEYEAALTELVAQGQRMRQTSLFWCEGPRQVLNKWRAK